MVSEVAYNGNNPDGSISTTVSLLKTKRPGTSGRPSSTTSTRVVSRSQTATSLPFYKMTPSVGEVGIAH